MMLESLSDEEYRARLKSVLGAAPAGSAASGFSLTVVPLASVESTMDEARDWRGPAGASELPRCACFWSDGDVDAGRLDGVCFLAREQRAGRGREDRSWTSGRDRGVYATFLFSPDCAASALAGYSLVVGLAVQAAIRTFGAAPIVKWPNDIVVEQSSGELRKLGGILVDSTGGADGPVRLSVGIGVNVLPQQLPDGRSGLEPISLSEITASEVDTISVFKSLAFELMVRSREFFRVGFASFQHRWERESGFVGREVLFSPPRQPQVRGTVQGVDSGGGLILAHDGGVSVYHSGSVTPLRSIAGDTKVR